ncbi:MAG: deoxyribose-phosphate aldolase [Chloroflexi bacterium]|nr:deoxyribose-phosphate aldolase [Chloroflexota bacterium]
MNNAQLDKLVDQITKQVLAGLQTDKPQPASAKPAGDCSDGRCVADRPKEVRQLKEVGASRFTSVPGAVPADQEVARLIDHTLLKPDATPDQIAQLCHEARSYHFASVCVNPTHVKLCADLLKGSDVKVCTVVGFPLGATPPEVKAFEAQKALGEGATEIDMVLNVGALKSGDYKLLLKDIASVVNVTHAANALCKVILETSLLNDEEKVAACQIAKVAEADFVKTSTGFGGGGATAADVALMRYVVGSEMGVKASGGVRNYEDAKKMVAAGATRIGASAGVRIVQEASGKKSAGGTSRSAY